MQLSCDNLGIIGMPGTEGFSTNVDYYLKKWYGQKKSFLIDTTFPRFTTGDGKAVLNESIRGKDLFIISDPYNYSLTYNMRGLKNHMSPDDHFQNIKRIISAINGKAKRTTLMMNMLYGSRQHGRTMRESLDCAQALRELENLGIKNIITFDAHDPKVQNAIPLVSFDNFYPNYQMVKAYIKTFNGIDLENTRLVAPDAGGIQRCIKFAESLDLEIGMFYKQRATNKVENGENAIEKHEFLGKNIEGKDVIVVDDILATGDSLIDSFYKLKALGAQKVTAFITFGMFTKGYDNFDRAFNEKVFDKIFITNLSYQDVEKPYIGKVDLTKYSAYIIDSLYRNMSVKEIMDPSDKIKLLFNK